MQILPDRFPGLDEAATLFRALRGQPPAVGRAGRAALAAAGVGSFCPDLIDAAARVADALDAHAASGPELPYHNRHHFIEATLAMGWLAGTAHALRWLEARPAGLGVVAMLGHDLLHDGSWPFAPGSTGALEARSAALTQGYAAAAGVPASDIAVIGTIILGTKPSVAAGNAARALGRLPPGPLGEAADRLRALAVEADLFASALPELGWRHGEALAAEWGAAPGAARVATFAGRLEFLRRLPVPTPAAERIGLPALTAAQLKAFVGAVPAPGTITPDAAAAALDAMPRAAARAAYRAALQAARRCRDAN
jgi:hypothetical protein